MEEFRVPVARIPAEVVMTDGRALAGNLFVPMVASTHDGPMRPDELMNEHPAFFPFLEVDAEMSILLNKAQVLLVTIRAWREPTPAGVPPAFPERFARVELRDRVVEGTVVIDMPEHQGRMLDYLNFSGQFITVRAGELWHLIQRNHILRVVDVQKE